MRGCGEVFFSLPLCFALLLSCSGFLFFGVSTDQEMISLREACSFHSKAEKAFLRMESVPSAREEHVHPSVREWDKDKEKKERKKEDIGRIYTFFTVHNVPQKSRHHMHIAKTSPSHPFI